MRYYKVCQYVLIFLFSLSALNVSAANLDPLADGSHYVWGENIGWIDLAPSVGSGVTITDSAVTGMAWSENTGWIDLSPVGGGVTNDGTGKLSGVAWSENSGWIDFNPAGGGVNINACGEFNGTAWGENVGWISFRSDSPNPFKVVSSWVSPVDSVPPVSSFFPPIQPWYTTNILFNFDATDCGSGVKEIHNKINNGTETVTPGATAQTTVSQEGCNTLQYFAVDNAGNPEASRQLSICVDKTPPLITLTVPPDSATYYINNPVTPVYTINDAISGVKNSSVDTMTTNLAGSYSFTVAATDVAGNSATVTHAYNVVYPGNIDPGTTGCEYAWGENIGWIYFKPAWGPGVTTTNTALTGMAWSENVGWIIMDPENGGVVNDGMGNLSGFAWNENAGWIDFNPADGGVAIGTDGSFSGNAWGENIGWIVFNAPNTCLKSAWLNPYPPVAPFSFASQTTFSLNTDITSNTITVSGINTSWPIKISGGQYSINGSPFTSTTGTVNNGDKVAVKVTSAATYSATTSALVAIGGVSATFSITTVKPQICNWNGAISGNWSTSANWSCGHSPGAGDDAIITVAGTYTVTLDGNATVNSLNLGGTSGTQTLLAASRTLTINNASTVVSQGSISLSGITISGTGSLTNQGAINLTSSTINTTFSNAGTLNVYQTNTINGALTTQVGSLLHLEVNGFNNTLLTVANGFTNNGTIELTSLTNSQTTSLFVTNGTLLNSSTGVINALAGFGGGRTLAAELNNQGIITANNPLRIVKASAAQQNSGTLNVNDNLTLSGTSASFTNTGTITIASGKSINVGDGTFSHTSGTLTGAGTLSFSYTTVTFNSSFSLGGLVFGSTVATIPTGSTFSALTLFNSTVTLSDDLSTATTSLSLDNSTINGAGRTITNAVGKTVSMTNNNTIYTAFNNAGTLNVYPTNNKINGAFTTQVGSLLHLEANNINNTILTVANGFINNGTIELTSLGSYSPELVATNGTFLNSSTGVINALGNGSGIRLLDAALNNQGTITASYPLRLDRASTNSGTINVNNNLYLVFSPSFTNTGTIQGNSTFDLGSATFSNAGTIIPGTAGTAGTLTVTGPFPETSAGAVNIDIGGTTVATQYDQVAISGLATLNGALNVSLINSFVPAVGNSFTIMTYGSRSGTFSSLNLPSPGVGNLWALAYNTNNVTLSIMPGVAVTVTPATLLDGAIGTVYNQTVSATGGDGSYIWSVSSGVLPHGLSLNPSTGVISGTPDTLGQASFAIRATDSQGNNGEQAFTITVNPLPPIRYMLGSTPGYVTPATLQNVYEAAPAGATIQLMTNAVTGPLDAGTNKTIILKGGYDGSYSSQSGRTIINSPLKVHAGKVIANAIGVR